MISFGLLVPLLQLVLVGVDFLLPQLPLHRDDVLSFLKDLFISLFLLNQFLVPPIRRQLPRLYRFILAPSQQHTR
jgi:hypothetical protein